MTSWLIDKSAGLVLLLLTPIILAAIGACYLFERLTGKDTACN